MAYDFSATSHSFKSEIMKRVLVKAAVLCISHIEENFQQLTAFKERPRHPNVSSSHRSFRGANRETHFENQRDLKTTVAWLRCENRIHVTVRVIELIHQDCREMSKRLIKKLIKPTFCLISINSV